MINAEKHFVETHEVCVFSNTESKKCQIIDSSGRGKVTGENTSNHDVFSSGTK